MRSLSLLWKVIGFALSYYIQTLVFISYNSNQSAKYFSSLSIAAFITAIAAGGSLEFFSTRCQITGQTTNNYKYLAYSLCFSLTIATLAFFTLSIFNLFGASLLTYALTILSIINLILSSYYGSKSFVNRSLLSSILPQSIILIYILSPIKSGDTKDLLVFWAIGLTVNLAVYLAIFFFETNIGRQGSIITECIQLRFEKKHIYEIVATSKSKFVLILNTIAVNWFQNGVILATSFLLTSNSAKANQLATFAISLKYICVLYFITSLEQLHNTSKINQLRSTHNSSKTASFSMRTIVRNSTLKILAFNLSLMIILTHFPLVISEQLADLTRQMSFKVALVLTLVISLSTPLTTILFARGNAKTLSITMISFGLLEAAFIFVISITKNYNNLYEGFLDNLLPIHMLFATLAYVSSVSILLIKAKLQYRTNPTNV